MPADDVAKGREEDGVFARFVGIVHANELPHGVGEFEPVAGILQRLVGGELDRYVGKPAAALMLLQEHVDQVALLHTHFVSVAKLEPKVSILAPVTVPERKEEGSHVDYLYEPEPEEVLARLLPHFIEAQVYAAVLDNLASFYSAQMIAMRNATDNAGELINDLTLLRNKVRQATITKELMEIVGGAEALAAG